jgi:hypothetical protein
MISPWQPLSIARWLPRNWRGARCISLAPPAALLKRFQDGGLSEEGYKKQFRAHLATLDAAAIRDQLPPSAALLCFCDPDSFCHRFLVAAQLKAELGAEVAEYDAGPASTRSTTKPRTSTRAPAKPKLPDVGSFDCDHCPRKNITVAWGAKRSLCPRCKRWSEITEWED